jgi:hypothetical protein
MNDNTVHGDLYRLRHVLIITLGAENIRWPLLHNRLLWLQHSAVVASATPDGAEPPLA